jgi:hypothetical protein
LIPIKAAGPVRRYPWHERRISRRRSTGEKAMAKSANQDELRFDETSWHNYMAKITATFPPDVAKAVMHSADEAGAEHGAMLMLEILRHLRIGDDEDLSDKAREAVDKHKKR